MARRWHPDTNREPDATKRMQDINEAYLILSNAHSRSRYNTEYDHYVMWATSAAAHPEPPSHASSPSSPGSAEPRASHHDYDVQDDVLKKWMNDAASRARDLGRQAIEDASGILADAGRSAAQTFVAALLMLALMYFLMLAVGGFRQ